MRGTLVFFVRHSLELLTDDLNLTRTATFAWHTIDIFGKVLLYFLLEDYALIIELNIAMQEVLVVLLHNVSNLVH